ncbi:histidine kinase [Nocardioides phosphati]|uniref:Sensor-like histidine kinase SenX3 n=1 Tax=Nocardioides phosphati TaxID=1867775 RepID=A0ABQ2N8E7_9ACTN|nr:ATP-binding protein [Nocardioides phosphati]GGO85852.1 histidine kinase [Nocardioides phosphati]
MSKRPSGSRELTIGAGTVLVVVALLGIVVLAGIATATLVLRNDLTSQYEQRALAVARSVAQEPGLGDQVLHGSPSATGPVQQAAEHVRRATGALYVVVTDDRGIRYSHPDVARIGKKVSTSPDEALAGHEVVTVERGTLGTSARGKVPLRAADGTIVGEVSVGISTDRIAAATRHLALALGVLALAPLGLGLLGALTLGRRLTRRTLGLAPGQLADLVREHEAVLRGVRDGVIGLDPRGRVTVTNPEADRLLGYALERGDPVTERADPALARLVAQEPAPDGELALLGDQVVLATRLAVRRDGRDLGQVLILRDRSDLDTLARELEATRALTDALRAQAHEHANRLHGLAGLLHLGRLDEARDYLDELSEARTWVPGLKDPYLAGLVAAKSAMASEAGVALTVAEETWVDGELARPLEVVTVVANLLDNAIRAAAAGSRRPAGVVISLLGTGTDLLVHVEDTGDGVAAADAAVVFDHGFTTRSGDRSGHGIGLSLARHTARSGGGDLVLRDRGGSHHGAVFEATLRGALAPTVNDPGRDA